MISDAGEGLAHRRRELFDSLALLRNISIALSLLLIFSHSFQNFHHSSQNLFQATSFNEILIDSDRRWRSSPVTLFQFALSTIPLVPPLLPNPSQSCKSEFFEQQLDFPTTNHSPAITTPCGMPSSASASSPIPWSFMRSRRTLPIPYPAEEKLGFFLLGMWSTLGPLSKSRPILKSKGPNPKKEWPRSVLPIFLSTPYYLLHRFSALFGHGLQSRRELIILRYGFCHLKTWSLYSSLDLLCESLLLLPFARRYDFGHRSLLAKSVYDLVLST
ncbi:hypothetical protein AXX17_AT1G35720 [Arabidopsis thaliana]|uniref:Uncharacterized protein n=1 Tax=Arabidopsis thaliana TaxID=3702 RepID=A0A178W920_ARATH|nr:hypothetical protein AXX17_AT1G35720 [Arabidopsis thaliana]